MPDWQSGMSYLLDEQARRGQGEQRGALAAWDALPPERQQEIARQAGRSVEEVRADLASGVTSWGGGSGGGFRVGLEEGAPTFEAGPVKFRGPTVVGGDAPFATPPMRPPMPGQMTSPGGAPMPGGQFNAFSPTPPILSGEFAQEGGPYPQPADAFMGEGGGGGGPLRAIGRFITRNPELITGLAGTAANVYGAAQEGKARGEELDEQRRQHEAELEERRKQREQDRIDMILRGIGQFAG
jgi:hypothetical protein